MFRILALGETVLATGLTIVVVPATVTTVATGSAALLGTVAPWLVAFGGVGRLIVRHVEGTGDPVHATRLAGNVLTLMVAGLIAGSGVGCDQPPTSPWDTAGD